ncbi:MAG: hypothetical protein QNI96_05245 [Woeseiaceae bacterium]|nr:hypothetical protein [Woeseiaceae bacterium]
MPKFKPKRIKLPKIGRRLRASRAAASRAAASRAAASPAGGGSIIEPDPVDLGTPVLCYTAPNLHWTYEGSEADIFDIRRNGMRYDQTDELSYLVTRPGMYAVRAVGAGGEHGDWSNAVIVD